MLKDKSHGGLLHVTYITHSTLEGESLLYNLWSHDPMVLLHSMGYSSTGLLYI
jgi:hypothetical protein